MAPATAKPGRNDPCHCGSGRKYKHCCLAKDEASEHAARVKAEAKAARAAAKAAEAEGADDATETTPAKVKAPRHETHQPWRSTTSRGFAPRTRVPRKVGGS